MTGADVLSPDEVRAAAAVPVGTPLARVDLDGGARAGRALPPVDRSRCHRELAGHLVVRGDRADRGRGRAAGQAVPAWSTRRRGVPHACPTGPRTCRWCGSPDPRPDDVATRAALEVLALAHRRAARAADRAGGRGAGPDPAASCARAATVIWGDATESGTKAKVATLLLLRQARRHDVIDVSAPAVVDGRSGVPCRAARELSQRVRSGASRGDTPRGGPWITRTAAYVAKEDTS